MIGAGFSGIGTAIKLDEAGIRDWVAARGGRRRRRGLALEHLSGHRRRHPLVQLPVLLRAALGLVARLRAGRGAEGLRRALRRRATACARGSASDTRVVGADVRRGGPPLAARRSPTGRRSPPATWSARPASSRQPKPPDIPGLDDFAGTVMHTARWDHDVDLRGKRVAMIGTGASAVQVIPSIAPEVEQLTVFQRTPIWCLPKPDGAIAPRARRVLERVPGAQRAARAASQAYVELTFPIAAHYHGVVPLAKAGERTALQAPARARCKDPVVREKLTPRYGLGCKRPSFSNEYLADLQPRRTSTLETTPIEAFTPSGRAHRRPASTRSTCWSSPPASRSSRRATCPPYPVRGSGRRRPRRVVGREPLPGLRGGQRPRLPEHVHDPRPLRLQRRRATST